VKRKMGIALDLDAHFRRTGRQVYIGSNLAVLYPGETVIVPDVLAVVDCDPDYEPERWVVLDEKRGIDLVIEVRNLGKKHKDLVENVRDYARVRIPEYFSYDCRSGALRGWRLADPKAQSYVPIVPQGGYLRSQVLGLDLAVVHNRLRFFSNESMIPSESVIPPACTRRGQRVRPTDSDARPRPVALRRKHAWSASCSLVARCEANTRSLSFSGSARSRGSGAWARRAARAARSSERRAPTRATPPTLTWWPRAIRRPLATR
jgi:Putative restriction endonuclease